MVEKAVVRSTFANVRAEPDQRSELYSQLIIGDKIEVIGKEGNFLKSRMFDNSEGLIHKGYLDFSVGKINTSGHLKKIMIDTLFCHVHKEPHIKSAKIKLVLDGSVFDHDSRVDDFYQVLLPGGETGWISTEHVTHLPPSDDLPESIAQRANRYLGVPYLWGGTTPLAFDCSGLVQYVYRLHGVILPRNSSQQAKKGEIIEPSGNWENLEKGDLLFFAEGSNVDHVAISHGGSELIHASLGNGEIRIESLDENASNFSEKLLKIFHSVRRIIN